LVGFGYGIEQASSDQSELHPFADGPSGLSDAAEGRFLSGIKDAIDHGAVGVHALRHVAFGDMVMPHCCSFPRL